jgi:hypothetical protein
MDYPYALLARVYRHILKHTNEVYRYCSQLFAVLKRKVLLTDKFLYETETRLDALIV